jgi:hypothetical protein
VGYASRQPLNGGRGLRGRSYLPIPVKAITCLSTDAWSKRNGAVAEITAWHSNSQFQALHLSQSEAEQTVRTLASAYGEAVRLRLVLELLGKMEDPELLRILATDLKTRIKS